MSKPTLSDLVRQMEQNDPCSEAFEAARQAMIRRFAHITANTIAKAVLLELDRRARESAGGSR